MSGKVQYNRAPCPGRIFEDLGNGFAIGCAGGTLFYFLKGKQQDQTPFYDTFIVLFRPFQRAERTTNHQWTMPCEEQSALPRRQFRSVGWHVLQYGLSLNQLQTKRWSIERDHGRIRNRRSPRNQRWNLGGLQVSDSWRVHPLPDWGCLADIHGHPGP